jgi:hypothetical protein
MGDLLGMNGNDKEQAAITALQNSPAYKSLYNNGLEANEQNAAATGGIRGGNEVRSLADFGADTLSSTIAARLASLGGLAGLGEGATDSVAGFGANKANAITALLGNIGGAKASGSLAKGGINAQMWNNAGSFLDQSASSFMGAGGAGGGGGGGFNAGQFASSLF